MNKRVSIGSDPLAAMIADTVDSDWVQMMDECRQCRVGICIWAKTTVCE